MSKRSREEEEKGEIQTRPPQPSVASTSAEMIEQIRESNPRLDATNRALMNDCEHMINVLRGLLRPSLSTGVGIMDRQLRVMRRDNQIMVSTFNSMRTIIFDLMTAGVWIGEYDDFNHFYETILRDELRAAPLLSSRRAVEWNLIWESTKMDYIDDVFDESTPTSSRVDRVIKRWREEVIAICTIYDKITDFGMAVNTSNYQMGLVTLPDNFEELLSNPFTFTWHLCTNELQMAKHIEVDQDYEIKRYSVLATVMHAVLRSLFRSSRIHWDMRVILMMHWFCIDANRMNHDTVVRQFYTHHLFFLSLLSIAYDIRTRLYETPEEMAEEPSRQRTFIAAQPLPERWIQYKQTHPIV